MDHARDCPSKTRTPPARTPAPPPTIDRAILVAQIREAEEALLDAEEELRRV